MRAVIDTNVLLAGLLWHGPPHALLEHVRSGKLAMVSSPVLLAELTEVIGRPKFDTIIEAWLPMTFAVNSINRSMGIDDLYPFVISPEVTTKLNVVHDIVKSHAKDDRTLIQRMVSLLAS